MKSYDLLAWGQPLQPRERELRAPEGTQVLLRLTHCGVCHTDVHIRDGHYNLGDGKKLSFAERGYELPMSLGHEPVGVATAVGPAARGVAIGSTYLVNPWIGCGHCRMCTAGQDNLCAQLRPIGMGAWGGFATDLLVPDARYLVDIEGLSPERSAPLACSGLTTYRAIKKLLPLDPADWVAVIGCGGLGLMAIAVLQGMGHERVIACDIDDAKLAAAQRAGAAHTCNLTKDGLERLSGVAAGSLYGMLDLVGSPATLGLAVPALRKGGRVVVCGLFGGTASVPIPLLALREISLLGSATGTTRDLIELVDLAKQGKLQLPDVQCRPLAMADQSLNDLAAGRVIGRVVLEVGVP